MAYQSEIEKLEQRYRENPDQWFAALADSYRKAGSLELALDVVRAGLEKRPNYVSGHIVLGRCLLQQPDDAAATGAFEKVLSLDAENVIALKALSEIAERAARLDDAKRWLARLLEVDPMNEEATQALARLQEAPAPAPAPAAGGEAAAVAETPGAPQAAPAAGVERTLAEMPAAAKPAELPSPPAAAPGAAPAEELALEKSEEATVGGMGLEAFELAPPGTPVAPELPAAAQPPAAPTPPAAPAAPPAAAATAPSEPAGTGADVEHMEFEADAGAAVPHAEGVENLEFRPPAPGETRRSAELEPMEFTPPEAAEGAGPKALPDVAPFDDQLSWGTGERQSGKVSQADVDAAEHAHEAALEPLAQEPPSPASAEVPPAGGTTGGDLPLIFPEEPAAKAEASGRDGEQPGGAEAAPVVTETMAELYVKQGLIAEAREIYRTLVAQRPGDAALASRLAALEAPAAVARQRSSTPVVAAETGGPSVRDFLSQVFGGVLAPPPAPEAPAPAAPPAGVEPLEPASAEPHDSAVGSEAGAGAGAPTRRASDEVSLAAVFGEEPAAPAPRTPGAGPAKAGTGGGGSFSFDEFFGGQGKGSDGAPSTRSSAGRTEEDEDDFKRWLKGLKS